MSFTSWAFVVFLAAVYAAYRVLPPRAQNWLLLLASYVFYGSWDARFLGLLAASTLVYHVTGAQIAKSTTPERRRLYLWLGVGINLAILAFFKYANFLLENLGLVFHALGREQAPPHLDLALPVGISFYTFQGMTYVIDIYRKRLKPTPNLSDFALFLAFFPLVLAGPIERASRLLPQITGTRVIKPGQTSQGLYLALQGLFKKVALADGVARTANAVFGASGGLTWIDVVAGTFFFAVQLYCDFSGYSDMAKGIASLFGIDLTANFRYPYFATNPADFWTRWHVSLSTWFRDYVFVPLGGASGPPLRWIRNVMVTFFVTGLWHGAAWNYILWGLYHGVLLCLHRLKEMATKGDTPPKGPIAPPSVLARALSIPAFFLLTCYGWILFRAHSLAQIADLTGILVRDFGNLRLTVPLPPEASLVGLPVLFAIELAEFAGGGKSLRDLLPVPMWTAVYAVMIFALVLGAGAASPQFVYFTF